MTIKEEFLSLLEQDREFRYAVAGLIGLGEVLRRLDEHGERMVKIEEELAKLREDMNKLREDMNKLREDMNRSFMLVERHISALGTRWGLMSEETFREGIKGLMERELGFKVERWVKFDGEGFVYGYPSQVEVDVAIHDERLILMEVKSHVRASDIYIFRRMAEFYEKVEGRKPARLIMVTPYADEKAMEASLRLGIEVYTKI